jgi:hypothetical protein
MLLEGLKVQRTALVSADVETDWRWHSRAQRSRRSNSSLTSLKSFATLEADIQALELVRERYGI